MTTADSSSNLSHSRLWHSKHFKNSPVHEQFSVYTHIDPNLQRLWFEIIQQYFDFDLVFICNFVKCLWANMSQLARQKWLGCSRLI
jgi:hypothetical protein